MSELPPGWVEVPFSQLIVDMGNGAFVSRPGIEPNGVPILRVSALRSLALNLKDIRYSRLALSDKKVTGRLLSAGDLLFARLNGNPDYVGVCAVVSDGIGPLLFSDKQIRVRIRTDIADPHYVAYAFASPRIRALVRASVRTTAGQASIAGSDIAKIPLPVPPLAEQRRIIAALEEYLSRLDVGQSLTCSVHRKCEMLLSRVRDEYVGHLAGTITSLGSVLREPLANGRSVPTEEGGFPVLRLTALRNGTLDISQRKGGRWTATEAAPFLVQEGDFFISRGNGSLDLVGRGGLLEIEPDPVAFPDTMVRIRVDRKQMLPQFLRLIWDSRGVRKQIESAARTTAGIYKINQSMIEAIKIPVPDIEVQRETITAIQQTLYGIERANTQVNALQARSERLRSALLTEAIAGRLVPQNPSDEPASVLLERTRAERTAVSAPGRRASRTSSGASRTRTKSAPQKETLL